MDNDIIVWPESCRTCDAWIAIRGICGLSDFAPYPRGCFLAESEEPEELPLLMI